MSGELRQTVSGQLGRPGIRQTPSGELAQCVGQEFFDSPAAQVEELRGGLVCAAEQSPSGIRGHGAIGQQHRRRAESLMELALELNGHLRLPDFARNFVGRAANIMGVHQAALVVKQATGMETLVIRGTDDREIQERSLLRRFSHAVEEALVRHEGTIVSSSATELFGAALASELGEGHGTLVRLLGASGELVGVLFLGDREQRFADEDTEDRDPEVR